MKRAILTSRESNATRLTMNRLSAPAAALAAVALTGCIQVQTPDEPIVIELNINVEQTIDVNLQEDVQDLIEENPELFPQ